MQNIYRRAEIPACPGSCTRELGAVMNNFPAAWAQYHSLMLPMHPRCKPSAKSCACRDKSSGDRSRAVQGCEGMSRLPRTRARLTRPQGSILSPRLGGLFPWAVSTGQAVYLAALVLWGWARRKVPRVPFPSLQFWEGRRPGSPPLHCSSWPLLSFCAWVVVAAECEWGRERRGREGSPKKSATEHIRNQAPGMMPSVWPGWQRSSAHKMFTNNPQVFKGRNLPSVSKRALKMQKKNPLPISTQRSNRAISLLLAGGKDRKKRESGWDASGVPDCFWWGACSHPSSSPWLHHSTTQSYWKCILWRAK